MTKQKAYDLPTRLFHWLFAGLFVAAFTIAKTTDDESIRFTYHMVLGLVLFTATILRIVWGFVGSRYAKFSSFPLHPSELVRYFREILSSGGKRYFGHNPASAWATVAMLTLATGLGVTGILMATGGKETYEDVHEVLANLFTFVAIGHVAGVVLHMLRHKDGISGSMLHGDKVTTPEALPITNSHSLAAFVMAGVIGLVALQLYKGFDSNQRTASVFGLKLQLGENEGQEGGEGEASGEDQDDDD